MGVNLSVIKLTRHSVHINERAAVVICPGSKPEVVPAKPEYH